LAITTTSKTTVTDAVTCTALLDGYPPFTGETFGSAGVEHTTFGNRDNRLDSGVPCVG